MSKEFATKLLEEVLLLDEDQQLIGNVVLIDPETKRERYQASFDLEDSTYIVERATDWDDTNAEVYQMATDGEVELSSQSRTEIATYILDLASEHGLQPGYFVLHGEDEDE